MTYDDYVCALDKIYNEFYELIESFEDPLLREALHLMLFYEKHERIILIGALIENSPTEIIAVLTKRQAKYASVQDEANAIYHRFQKDKNDRLSKLSSPLGRTLRSLASLAISLGLAR
jgi:hypothetical protein